MGTTATLPRHRITPPPPKSPRPRAGGPASCPANIRETLIAIGFAPQTDLPTPNDALQMFSVTKTNATLSVVNPNVETDAQDTGKGDEFPTQTFPTSMDTAVAVEKYNSSEFAAWLFCFSTGKATKTPAGTTGFTYVAEPSDPVVNCINLPPFTYGEQIRPAPDSVIDRAMVGMVVQDWTLNMESGPGRANCRLSCNLVGTGKVVAPSGITPWPVVTTEHFLNAASAQITINGIDYILSASFVSLEMKSTNNVRLDTGFYPGSGVDENGFALRGRMEYGDRVYSLTFVARAQRGSQEYLNLINQTPGPGSITLKGALIETGEYHSMDIEIPKLILTSVVNGDQNGIVTVNCTATLIKLPDQPLLTMGATTTMDGILGL